MSQTDSIIIWLLTYDALLNLELTRKKYDNKLQNSQNRELKANRKTWTYLMFPVERNLNSQGEKCWFEKKLIIATLLQSINFNPLRNMLL